MLKSNLAGLTIGFFLGQCISPPAAHAAHCRPGLFWRPSHRVCATWAPRAHVAAHPIRHVRVAALVTHRPAGPPVWAGKIPYWAFVGMVR